MEHNRRIKKEKKTSIPDKSRRLAYIGAVSLVVGFSALMISESHQISTKTDQLIAEKLEEYSFTLEPLIPDHRLEVILVPEEGIRGDKTAGRLTIYALTTQAVVHNYIARPRVDPVTVDLLRSGWLADYDLGPDNANLDHVITDIAYGFAVDPSTLDYLHMDKIFTDNVTHYDYRVVTDGPFSENPGLLNGTTFIREGN